MPAPPPPHTHTNDLESQLCSLKNFLNTVTTHHTVHNTNTAITDHANSTYCSTKHSHTRPHTIWSNENDPKSQVNRHTYIPPVRDVNSSPSLSHTHSPTQTNTHTYYYDSPLLNRSALERELLWFVRLSHHVSSLPPGGQQDSCSSVVLMILMKRYILQLPRLSCPPFKSDASSQPGSLEDTMNICFFSISTSYNHGSNDDAS